MYRFRRFIGPAGLALLALLGAGLTLARQAEYGVGLGFDSANYAAAASQFSKGNPPLTHRVGWFVEQPPFYSLMLAVAGFGHIDPVQVAGPLNAALLGATILVGGAFLRRRLAAQPVWAWCGCVALAIGPLADAAATMYATQAFVLFTVSALACVAVRDPPWRRLALAAVFAALACLTRYVGVTLVVAVAGVLLVSSALPWQGRLQRAAAFAAVAFAPLGLWLLRNQFVTGTLTMRGVHEPVPWLDALSYYADQVAIWVFLELPVAQWQGRLALVALSAAAILTMAVYRKRLQAVWHSCWVFGGFVLVYLAVLTLALALAQVSAAQRRYGFPLYAPLLLFVWLVVGGLLGGDVGRRRGGKSWTPRDWACAAMAVIALPPWLGYQGVVMQKAAIEAWNAHGYSYDGPRWRDSDALRALRHAPLAGTVHTQYTVPVFLHAQQRALAAAPDFAEDGGYLLWFFETNVPEPLLRGETWTRAGVDIVANYADGVLLRGNPKSNTTLQDIVWARLVPAGPPAAGAFFNLRLDRERRTLVYAKRPCAPADTQPTFFLHILPHRRDDLPEPRVYWGFDNLDFEFANWAVWPPSEAVRRCVAVVPLPDYPIAGIRTGQFERAGRNLWQAHFDFDEEDAGSRR